MAAGVYPANARPRRSDSHAGARHTKGTRGAIAISEAPWCGCGTAIDVRRVIRSVGSIQGHTVEQQWTHRSVQAKTIQRRTVKSRAEDPGSENPSPVKAGI